ncbi:MAG: tetratricopeptide repeat protein [Armatimonadetes bacterium]|nr:tetratricopeptide repeat protein [Armatimonadota bacterium]
MAFIGDWFTFGYDQDFDDGVRAYEQGNDLAAANAFRESMRKATSPVQKKRAADRLVVTLVRMGRKAANDGDTKLATECLGEAVQLRPGYADIRISAAWAAFCGHDWATAQREAQAALAINPENQQALVVAGLTLVAIGKRDEGFDLVARAVEEWPAAPGVVLNALEAWQGGHAEAAVSIVLTARPVSSQGFEGKIESGDNLVKARKWLEAEAVFREVLQFRPHYADVWVRHGQCQMQMDDLDGAISDFSEALAINPRYAQAWALLGVAYRRVDEEDMALDAFRRALEIDKDEPIATHEIERRR